MGSLKIEMTIYHNDKKATVGIDFSRELNNKTLTIEHAEKMLKALSRSAMVHLKGKKLLYPVEDGFLTLEEEPI